MAADTSISFTDEGQGEPSVLGAGGPAPRAGIGPYRLALIRLRRNKVALAFGALFVLIVVMCLLAPFYAHHIAHTGPNDAHVTDTVKVGGKSKDVVSPDGIPIGPTWHGRFFLGADDRGRDVAGRLVFGGPHAPAVRGAATRVT